MKKILVLLLTIVIMQQFASVTASESESSTIAMSKHAAPIEDELIKSNIFPEVIPTFVKQHDPIVDELVVPYQRSNTVLKIWARKDAHAENIIEDELVDSQFKSNFSGINVLWKHRRNNIEDKFAKKIQRNGVRIIKVKNEYDFSKRQIPVQLKVAKAFSTKHKIAEGDEVLFKTTKGVELNGEYLPKGTSVIGRIETISASDKMGTPANIIIDNFYIKDRPDICLYGNVSKTGANRSLWVYPLYQAGNIMFYVAGFVFVPIHGGHAKVLTNDTFTLYYETN